MSTHAVRVVCIAEVRPHPNADKLEIVPIPGTGWQSVVQKGAFRPGDLAIYIEPDMVVSTTRTEFSFLAKAGKDTHRLRAIRLRGEPSFGLLIPAPAEPMIDMDTNEARYPREGDNFMRALGVTRYEPPLDVKMGADNLAGPWPIAPKFDVESYQNWPSLIAEGEEVVITEKIHGANARYLYKDDTFYMGSRNRWLNPNAAHVWSMAAANSYQPLEDGRDSPIFAWCKKHPGVILYGEIYGLIQSLHYGQKRPKFAAFAAYDHGKWRGPEELALSVLVDHIDFPIVPILGIYPWHLSLVQFAENESAVPGAPEGHMREGIVITPRKERVDPNIGRVALKYISNRYWTSSHA